MPCLESALAKFVGLLQAADSRMSEEYVEVLVDLLVPESSVQSFNHGLHTKGLGGDLEQMLILPFRVLWQRDEEICRRVIRLLGVCPSRDLAQFNRVQGGACYDQRLSDIASVEEVRP